MTVTQNYQQRRIIKYRFQADRKYIKYFELDLRSIEAARATIVKYLHMLHRASHNPNLTLVRRLQTYLILQLNNEAFFHFAVFCGGLTTEHNRA